MASFARLLGRFSSNTGDRLRRGRIHLSIVRNWKATADSCWAPALDDLGATTRTLKIESHVSLVIQKLDEIVVVDNQLHPSSAANWTQIWPKFCIDAKRSLRWLQRVLEKFWGMPLFYGYLSVLKDTTLGDALTDGNDSHFRLWDIAYFDFC